MSWVPLPACPAVVGWVLAPIFCVTRWRWVNLSVGNPIGRKQSADRTTHPTALVQQCLGVTTCPTHHSGCDPALLALLHQRTRLPKIVDTRIEEYLLQVAWILGCDQEEAEQHLIGRLITPGDALRR